MKYQKPLIAALVIIIIAVGIAFIVSKKRSGETRIDESETQVKTTENTDAITMQPEMISVAEDSYLHGISGYYPKFTQTDESFNKKIEQFAISGVTEFKKEADANYKAQLETGGDDFLKQFENGGMYTYQIKTNIIQSNNNFISMTIIIAGYSGGAHGYETTTSFNYDVKNKKEIELDYFFPNNPDVLKTVSDISRSQLTPKIQEAMDQKSLDPFTKEMLADGTDPLKPINFKVFTFTNDTLTIYFGQYQVAAYAYGQFTVDIPRNNI